MALTASIGALFAPIVIAIDLEDWDLFAILQTSATMDIGSDCFNLPSSTSLIITWLPSSRNASRSSVVTGSSNKSVCIDGTKQSFDLRPLLAERAISKGESIIPCTCFEIVFLVAGAISVTSK